MCHLILDHVCGATAGGAPTDAWAFIGMVDDLKKERAKREYRGAMLARRARSVAALPSAQARSKAAGSSLLTSCPVTRQDALAADHILGKNVSALKGKTACRQGSEAPGKLGGAPRGAQARFKRVKLAIDATLVNKLPFLITMPTGLRFGTVEVLESRQVPDRRQSSRRAPRDCVVAGDSALTHARRTWSSNRYKTLFPALLLILRAENEHAPEIERCTRAAKGRARSGRSSLPLERAPRLALARPAYNCVFWLNAFPHENGVSDALSPRRLLAGRRLGCRRRARLELGACARAREDHSSGAEPRACGAICLGPTGSEQGGRYFTSLVAGRRLTRSKWAEPPAPRDAITRAG